MNKLSNMALQEDMRKEGNWLFKYRSYLPLFILVIGLALYIKGIKSKLYFRTRNYRRIYL